MKHLTQCERRDELVMGVLSVMWTNLYALNPGSRYIPLISILFGLVAAFGTFLNGSFLYSPVMRAVGLFGLFSVFAYLCISRMLSGSPDYATYLVLSVLYLKVAIGAVKDAITTLRSHGRWMNGSS